jgi:hypothetical protein
MQRHGVNGAMTWIRESGGDTSRFTPLLPLIPEEGDRTTIDLNELFRASMEGQLRGASITIHDARKFIRTLSPPVDLRGDSRPEMAERVRRFATSVYPQFHPAPETVRTHRRVPKKPVQSARDTEDTPYEKKAI